MPTNYRYRITTLEDRLAIEEGLKKGMSLKKNLDFA